MNLRWKKISKKTVALNKYRKMHTVRYRLPDGKISDFYIAERGKVVCIFVIRKDNKVVLAKQFRLGPERILYELPGGRVEKGETPAHAARREALEETGHSGTLIFLGQSSNDAWSTLKRYHYVLHDAKRVKNIQTDEHEYIEPVIVSLQQLRRILRQGNMTDAETAYRSLEYLGWLTR